MTAEEICSVIEEETGEPVTGDASIDSLNCDSLEFLNLIMVLGEATGKHIPDERLSELKTVNDIIAELA
jgi:acyl carrier protein